MINRRIKDFVSGSIIGCGIGAIGMCKVLDKLTEHKYFVYGFRDVKKSSDDKLIFKMTDFERNFVLEYNKRKESGEYNKEKNNDEQTFHNTFID